MLSENDHLPTLPHDLAFYQRTTVGNPCQKTTSAIPTGMSANQAVAEL
jgi:hypothetical protein